MPRTPQLTVPKAIEIRDSLGSLIPHTRSADWTNETARLEMSRYLDGIAQNAIALRCIVDGSDDKRTIRTVRAVRKALGYTYPVIVALFLLGAGACGVGSHARIDNPDLDASATETAVTDPHGQPQTSCVTCNKEPLATCDLCSMCKSPYFKSLGWNFVTVTGCLPEGTWCTDPSASTCRTQVCAECP